MIQLKSILEDKLACKLFLIVLAICVLSFKLGFLYGLLLSIISLATLHLTFNAKNNAALQNYLQEAITSFLQTKRKVEITNDPKIYLKRSLNNEIEGFFNSLLEKFICEWYSDISQQDSGFISNIKYELAQGIRKIAERYRNTDYPNILCTKLLPIAYSHFAEIEYPIKQGHTDEQLIQFFIDNGNVIHPAICNRKTELQYLRLLSEHLIALLLSPNNTSCRAAFNIVRELILNCVLLPVTDLISDPDIINLLVILATDPPSNSIKELKCHDEVELLENYSKSTVAIEINESNDNNAKIVDGNFFKDQEKLYNFMQYLKNKNNTDVEILKFVLDVEHLNSELEKSNVICDPIKLSKLQQTSESLLLNYRDKLFNGACEEKPKDLIEAYNHAKSILEYKWKYEFYKSGDYYKYIYGDREIYNYSDKLDKDEMQQDVSISNQKLAAKIRNAMTIKSAVDGIEEGDIQIWDAMDVASALGNQTNYMVRLRKERGQDLDNFMKTLFHSIEQEADMGEDVVEMQTKAERQRNKIKFGNNELYKNLFNIPGQSTYNRTTEASFIKTPTQSLLYFLAKIVHINSFIVRIFVGLLKILSNSDALVCMLIRKIAEKLLNQAVLAHIVRELKEKIFETNSRRPTEEEMRERKNLAIHRLEKLKKGLSLNLLFLQNPTLNKHLIYCLLDILIAEGFNELVPK